MFAPLPIFDPRPPAGHPVPVLWLRAHRRAWAFQPSVTADQIDAYQLWLHVRRTRQALRRRERELRPAGWWLLRVLLRRLRMFLQIAEGVLPPDVIAAWKRNEEAENADHG